MGLQHYRGQGDCSSTGLHAQKQVPDVAPDKAGPVEACRYQTDKAWTVEACRYQTDKAWTVEACRYQTDKAWTVEACRYQTTSAHQESHCGLHKLQSRRTRISMSLLTQRSSAQGEKVQSMHCIWVHSWTQLVSTGLLSNKQGTVSVALAAGRAATLRLVPHQRQLFLER